MHKHVVLLALLERLKAKPKPLFYLDSHAGRGSYDLESPESMRGDEWREGIARISDAPVRSGDLRLYQESVRAIRGGLANRYPGSPVLATKCLRETDRIVLIEQQIVEAQALELAVRGRRGVSVVCGDGYAGLKTYLPPRENRGLVLIDPPYESEREFALVERALQFGLSRWPNGVFAAWYPIKVGREASRMHAALRASPLRKLLLLELNVRPADSPLGLNGSGMVIANPPWRFEEEMRDALSELQGLLDPQGIGGVRVEWLVAE